MMLSFVGASSPDLPLGSSLSTMRESLSLANPTDAMYLFILDTSAHAPSSADSVPG